MPTYDVTLIMSGSDGKVTTLTGQLSDMPAPEPSPGGIDFSADFNALPAGHTMMTGGDWNDVFAEAIGQGVDVYCLEQNSDATRHDFSIIEDGRGGQCLRLYLPKASYGMGHRSTNLTLGPVDGAVNVSFEWLVEDPGVNLWTAGGGKWGGAIQYGPIQSGATGGIRFMMTWAGGASTLGKQDLTCSIQNQPDGGQWLQPPFYGYRPIIYDHWYRIHYRMRGGLPEAPGTVLCEYWKDDDPVMRYEAETTNLNAQQGKAPVNAEICAFFGGGVANAAPADAYFRFANYRVWVEG